MSSGVLGRTAFTPESDKHQPMQGLHELLKDFHVWSQAVYPGEFSYFPSLGKEFESVEIDFDHARSQIVSLIEGLFEERFTHPQNAIQNNLDDLELIEKALRQKSASEKDISVYAAWIQTSQTLLRKALRVCV